MPLNLNPGFLDQFKKLAKDTAAEIPNEAAKLAVSSAEKTAEGIALIGRAGAKGAKKVAEAAVDAIVPDKVEVIEVPDGETPESLEAGGKGKQQVAGAAAAIIPEQRKRITIQNRGVDIDEEDIEELRHILYSEIGNRSQEKRDLESRVVINTALNRLAENKKEGRGPQTLKEVLRQPNQYQGFDTKQYKISKEGKGNASKNAAIDKVLGELRTGEFKDNTLGSFYYIHKPDSTIEFDDTRPLY